MSLIKFINAAMKASALEDDVEGSVDFITDLVTTIKDTDGFKAKLVAGLEAIGAEKETVEEIAVKVLELVDVFKDTGVTEAQLTAIIELVFEIGGVFLAVAEGNTTLAVGIATVATKLGVDLTEED